MELHGTVGAVVKGRNGRLFLGRQDGFDLGRFTDGSALTASLLAQWRATLRRRGRELSRRGIAYVFLVAPDAPSVYPEDLPNEYPGPYRMAGQVFLEAMGRIAGVTFVYPIAALRAAKGGLDVYQKNDSHWTSFGSGVAYRDLMRVVPSRIQSRTVPSSEVLFTYRSSFGDLGSQLDPEIRADIPVASFDGPDPVRILGCKGAQRQTATHTRMASVSGGRVLAFRDSFMTDLSPYLARSFRDLLTLGTTTRLMLDAVDEWQPELVISEVAERRLVAFQTDHQTHHHGWMYLSDHTSDIGRGVLAALNLLPQDPSAAAAAIRSIGPGLSDDPSHAYSAAYILEAAGDLNAAARFVQPLVEARPQDGAALSLAARLVLRAGRAGEAVSFVEKAVAAAPWNGAYHELLTYALIQDQRPVEAAEVAEHAILSIDDHANLLYWTAVLRVASGKRDGAAEAISSALTLDPCNKAYHELASRLRQSEMSAASS